MAHLRIKSLIVALFCLSLSFQLSSCTSSDDEISDIEAEMGGLGEESDELEISDEADDLAEIDESALSDEVEDFDANAEQTDIAGLEDEEIDGELNDDLEGEEILDEDLDSEFAEGSEEGATQVAAGDDSEFDEFDEFDEMEDKELVQNEQSLQDELKQSGEGIEMPVAENAQPTFPEEVMGADPLAQGVASSDVPVVDSMPIDPMAPMPVVSSEADVGYSDQTAQLPQDDLGLADPIIPEDDNAPAEQSWIPVVKVKTDPFFRNERLMNAVYISRPKDSFEGISEKIFGADRVQEIKDDNPHLAKGLDPGDKIYYNSPGRPEDKTQLKFYYEDIGLKPQYYKTKEGDNMRRLGSKLLGFPEGWKEIWAINQNIDSKTILPGGMEIKYWTGDEQSLNLPMAMNETQPPTQAATDSQAAVGEEDFSSSGAIQDIEDLPAEPPLPQAQVAQGNNLEPEMIPDIEPFPEPGVVSTPVPTSTVSAVDPNQSLLSIGALALLLMAGVGLVAIQIKKRKDNTGIRPQSLEYTQV